MKPLFLNPPTFEDFDGGAGARYQASREVTSFWYPTWLCFPAGMIEGSRVVDAPVQKLTLDDCLQIARDYDMVVIYTSTPTLRIDTETARRIKAQNPSTVTVFTGPHVTILPEETLKFTAGAVDIVCRGEFDYTIKELAEGRPWEEVAGISFLKDGDRPPYRRPSHRDRSGRASLCQPDLPAGPAGRRIHHPPYQASLRLHLYQPRLPGPLHLLPLAPDLFRPARCGRGARRTSTRR